MEEHRLGGQAGLQGQNSSLSTSGCLSALITGRRTSIRAQSPPPPRPLIPILFRQSHDSINKVDLYFDSCKTACRTQKVTIPYNQAGSLNESDTVPRVIFLSNPLSCACFPHRQNCCSITTGELLASNTLTPAETKLRIAPTQQIRLTQQTPRRQLARLPRIAIFPLWPPCQAPGPIPFFTELKEPRYQIPSGQIGLIQPNEE